jgi:hypothetical protein
MPALVNNHTIISHLMGCIKIRIFTLLFVTIHINESLVRFFSQNKNKLITILSFYESFKLIILLQLDDKKGVFAYGDKTETHCDYRRRGSRNVGSQPGTQK